MSENDIDPQWQFTNNDRVSSPGPVHVHVEGAGGFRSVSRTPAAIAGVLLVCALGFLVFRGWDALPAQLNSSSSSSVSSVESGAVIRVTATGADPSAVTVKPGDTIVFVNTTDSPQILKSENLLGTDGRPMYTPAIFENARYVFVVGEQPNGEKSFASIVDTGITGKVTVRTAGTAVSAPRSSARSSSGVKNGCAQPLGSTDGLDLPAGECEDEGSGGSGGARSGGAFGATASGGSNSSSQFGGNSGGTSGTATSGSNGGSGNGTGNGTGTGAGDGTGGNGTDSNGNTIPTNPNTVSNGQVQGNTYGTINDVNDRTSNRPPSQAETGPGFILAVTLLLSVAAMCIVHRKQILG